MPIVNWKTTLVGVLTAFFAFIAFSPETFSGLPLLVSLSKFATAGGLAALGIVAKDRDVTGAGKAAHQVKTRPQS